MTAKPSQKEKCAVSPLFEGVKASQLAWLLNVGQNVQLKPREYLFRRGQACDQIFILLSGHIKLSIPVECGQDKVIEFLSPGEAFGESALLPGHLLLADAQALETHRASFSLLKVKTCVLP
jgi:CRP-like cAMP-binding protein